MLCASDFTNFKTTDHEIPYLAFPASLRNTNRDPPIVSLKAAFIRRSIRQGFCAPDFANFSDIIDHADDDLFKQILSNANHVLAPLLPDKTESHYSLRCRPHDRQLIPKLTKVQLVVSAKKLNDW